MINEIKFNGSTLKLQLEAQTPILHFQAETAGATVRASEVKPKLDKFLIKKIKKETGIENLKADKNYKDYFIGSDKKRTDSLKYKMQIFVEEEPSSYVAGVPNNYDIFFGNRGKGGKKKAVFSNPILSIKCFHPGIRKVIEENIEEFFLIMNFGTMQGKGFGCFVPENIVKDGKLDEDTAKKIGKALKENAEASVCYYRKVPSVEEVTETWDSRNEYCKKVFKEIKYFYSGLKSGRSNEASLYHYFNRNVGKNRKYKNETDWMKEALRSEFSDTRSVRFTRVLLGLSSSYGKGNIIWRVNDANKEIERIPSPIYFKIIGDRIFVVAKKVPVEVYNRKFFFQKMKAVKMDNGKTRYEKSGRGFPVFSLNANELNLQNLLMAYVGEYNKTLDKVHRYVEVVE